MIELFKNIGTWFVTNLEMIKTISSIIAVLIMLIVLVTVLVHKKMIAHVNSIVEGLSKIVEDYKSIMTELSSMKSTIEAYDVTTNKTIDEMSTVTNLDTQMLKKINSVLDILALAYSTIKNDEIRLGISSIVNYAKYLDPNRELITETENKLKSIKANKIQNTDVPKTQPVITKEEVIVKPITQKVTSEENNIRRW